MRIYMTDKELIVNFLLTDNGFAHYPEAYGFVKIGVTATFG